MGLFTRLKMGLVLTKDSLLVIKHNPRLALFPIVSGIAGLAFLTIFLGITFGLAQIDPEGGILVGLLVIYLGLTFISSFFTAALVHQTREVLSGGEISLKAGMAAAWEKKWLLFVWSVVAATVGVIINAIENSDSRLARTFAMIFSVAWTLMTFLIIPIIMFERTSATGMFKESARKFKQTFGETPVSLIGISVVSFLLVIPFAAVGGLLLSADLVVAAVGVFLFGIATSFIISQTLQGVVKTALYYYAEEGVKPEEFDNVDFQNLSNEQDSRTRATTKQTGGGFV